MEEALRRTVHGGALLLLNCPPHLQFTMDLRTHLTGSLFRGIKMIPPGIHYFAASYAPYRCAGSAHRR